MFSFKDFQMSISNLLVAKNLLHSAALFRHFLTLHPGEQQNSIRHVPAHIVHTRRVVPINLPPIRKEYMLQ